MRQMYANRKEQFSLPPFKTPDAPVIISLTSYKHRIKDIIPTLKTLNNQSVKADKIVLYIAFEDEEYLYPELTNYCEIRLCKDTRSHKKFNGFWDFPDCYVATADDDLLYDADWLKTLLQACQLSPNCVAAHNTFRLGDFSFTSLATRKNNASSLNGTFHMYVMSGAGVMIQPGTAEKITELKDAWKFSPYCDEKPLSVILKAKGIPVVATSMISGPHHKEAYRNSVSLWDMYNCQHQKERWDECKVFLQAKHLL